MTKFQAFMRCVGVLAVVASVMGVGAVQAQPKKGAAQTNPQPIGNYYRDSNGYWVPVTPSTPMPVDATVSVSASIAPFGPVTTGTPLAVTTGGTTGTLPAGDVVVAFNTGTTNTAYCALGAAATTASIPLAPNGGWFAFTVGGATQLTCVTSTSTTTVNTTGGAGLPAGTGGGSGGGGGGGGNVTIVGPLGTQAIAASVAVTPATSSVWASSQSGVWNIGTLTSITNPVAVTGTFWPTTQPISAASGALASGSIAAGAMVDFLTTRQTMANGTAASNSQAVGGQYNSTPLTLTNGQGAALQLDPNGYLKVNIATGGGSGGTSSTFGATFPGVGTAFGATDGTNMIGVRAGAIDNMAAATNFLNTISGCEYNATPLTITDTRYQGLQCTLNGYLQVNVANATTAIGNNADNVTPTSGGNSPVVSYLYGYDSANWDRLPGNSTDGLLVNLGANNDVTVTNIVPNSDPCRTTAASVAPISITSATTTRIITPSSSNKTYICYMYLQTGVANNIAVVEGTGGTCGTGTAGIVGGTTATNGLNNAANSGQQFTNGGGTTLQTAGTNVDVCLITSSVGPVAGHVRYVQAP